MKKKYDLLTQCIMQCETEKGVLMLLESDYFTPINWGTFLKPLPRKKETFVEFLQRKFPNLALLDNY